MKVCCHRGASALAPENTLQAFRVALEHGVDFSELDVWLDASGSLVVTHDAPGSAQVPRLTEVFDLVRGTKMGLYVELKGPGTAEALGQLVATGAAKDIELISGSFVLDYVKELHDFAPQVARSILFGADWQGQTHAMIDACHAAGAHYAHPCFRPVDRALIDAFHGAHLQVMTPHSNEPGEVRLFAELGVDVIASDDPRLLVLTSR